MDCKTTLALMDDWVDGAIDPAQRHAIERHLSTCASCGAAFEAQQRLAGDLSALGGAADAIAAGPAESAPKALPGASVWGTTLRFAAAMVLAVGAAWMARVALWPVHEDAGRSGPMYVENDARNHELPADSGPTVILASDRAQMAVEVESSNPRIHIVWLYDTPVAESDGDEDPTSAPASAT